MQTYSATETQLMRRNGDIEHVRRSRRKRAPGHSPSPEEQLSGGEDANAASESSEGAGADPGKGEAMSAEDAKQGGGIRKSVEKARKSKREAGEAGTASVKQKRKRRESEAAADASLAAAAGSGKKTPKPKRHEKAAH